jgi:hypothetical protein
MEAVDCPSKARTRRTQGEASHDQCRHSGLETNSGGMTALAVVPTPQAAPVKTMGQKERGARTAPAISKTDRKRKHAHLLQTQKVLAKNSPALFDGVLHKASQLVHMQQVVNKQNSSAVDKVSIACSCGGENERCYRCYGLGYYEVSRQCAAAIEQVSALPTMSRWVASLPCFRQSRASKGNARERAVRYLSAHDAYDEESSS